MLSHLLLFCFGRSQPEYNSTTVVVSWRRSQRVARGERQNEGQASREALVALLCLIERVAA